MAERRKREANLVCNRRAERVLQVGSKPTCYSGRITRRCLLQRKSWDTLTKNAIPGTRKLRGLHGQLQKGTHGDCTGKGEESSPGAQRGKREFANGGKQGGCAVKAFITHDEGQYY